MPQMIAIVQKIHLQPRYCDRKPPIAGPSKGAMLKPNEYHPRYPPRSDGGAMSAIKAVSHYAA